VTDEGEPVVLLTVGGRSFPALIDTGFNGDLELPEQVRPLVNARFLLREPSLLAAGQLVEEDIYEVEFPFDGSTVSAEASFAPGGMILLGTRLLRHYRLNVDFPARTVLLERVAGP
jgi:predicted aspartyl protease